CRGGRIQTDSHRAPPSPRGWSRLHDIGAERRIRFRDDLPAGLLSPNFQTTSSPSVAYKENKMPWDDCQTCGVGQKVEIGSSGAAASYHMLSSVEHSPLQHDHLMSECRVLCLKSAL